jgi:cytochrome c biogenesis protein
MTVSTQGLELKTGSRALRATVELLSSMRFSISLLTVICIASVIGTVLKQHEPLSNYVNQFGPFWAEVFARANLYNVYSAWWFMTILGFLVTSTSLCVARNTPKIFADLRSYKENIREQSLKAFGHRAQAVLAESPEAAARRLGQLLASGGWKVKLQQREIASGTGWMLAAKAGAANKLGYIAAHSAIVLVCLGGLLDGDLMVRAQMLFNGKTPYNGGGMMADVKPEHRLDERNPTFRGNLLVAEGTQSDTAILSQSDGILLQELPFAVELKKFVVEYYSTGMPKLFASDIVIHDKETGEKIATRVEVNHPASHKGIEIYQSSFDDGGSTVRFKAIPMHAQAKSFDLEGTIGGSSKLSRGQTDGSEQLTVEYTGLRVINVENFAGDRMSGTDVRKVDLRATLDASLGAANKPNGTKDLRNVGPSVSYKLRDASGQAKEFNNYMLPVTMADGPSVFLLGMRETPSEPFRYLRIPVDAQGGMDDFMRLRYALLDPAKREKAVKRYALKAVDPKNGPLVQQLGASAARALSLFAGAGPSKTANSANAGKAGLEAVSDFIEANVPEAERNRAGEVLIRILNGALFELAQISREDARLALLPIDDKTRMFMTQSVLALSDVPLYPAPVLLQLSDFTQVQASVFQVARAPGKKVVYLGCALLILGVFAMLYIRERRLWIWFSPDAGAGTDVNAITHATMALSTNRKTMDGDREFDQLKARLLGQTS